MTFTGIVDDVGTIEAAADMQAGREFRVRCRYTDLAPGESVALNGACLTVRDTAPFTVEQPVAAAPETTPMRASRLARGSVMELRSEPWYADDEEAMTRGRHPIARWSAPQIAA